MWGETRKAEKRKPEDRFQGKELRVNYNPDSRNATISDMQGKELPALGTFYAWYVFHPETAMFMAQ